MDDDFYDKVYDAWQSGYNPDLCNSTLGSGIKGTFSIMR